MAWLATTSFLLIILQAVHISAKKRPGELGIEPCPDDWHRQGFKCLRVFNETVQREQASVFCRDAHRSSLIAARGDNNVISHLLRQNSKNVHVGIWIGLSFHADRDQFRWDNGDPVIDRHTNGLDVSRGHCVKWSNGKLESENCNRRLSYLCQKGAQGVDYCKSPVTTDGLIVIPYDFKTYGSKASILCRPGSYGEATCLYTNEGTGEWVGSCNDYRYVYDQNFLISVGYVLHNQQNPRRVCQREFRDLVNGGDVNYFFKQKKKNGEAIYYRTSPQGTGTGMNVIGGQLNNRAIGETICYTQCLRRQDVNLGFFNEYTRFYRCAKNGYLPVSGERAECSNKYAPTGKTGSYWNARCTSCTLLPGGRVHSFTLPMKYTCKAGCTLGKVTQPLYCKNGYVTNDACNCPSISTIATIPSSVGPYYHVNGHVYIIVYRGRLGDPRRFCKNHNDDLIHQIDLLVAHTKFTRLFPSDQMMFVRATDPSDQAGSWILRYKEGRRTPILTVCYGACVIVNGRHVTKVHGNGYYDCEEGHLPIDALPATCNKGYWDAKCMRCGPGPSVKHFSSPTDFTCQDGCIQRGLPNPLYCRNGKAAGDTCDCPKYAAHGDFCPKGWDKEIGCLRLFLDNRQFEPARAYCTRYGGELVRVDTDDKGRWARYAIYCHRHRRDNNVHQPWVGLVRTTKTGVQWTIGNDYHTKVNGKWEEYYTLGYRPLYTRNFWGTKKYTVDRYVHIQVDNEKDPNGVKFGVVDNRARASICEKQCPDSWYATGDAMCYKAFRLLAGYDEGLQICGAMGATLPIVDNENRYHHLQRISNQYGAHMWIGLRFSGGAWKWQDGSNRVFSSASWSGKTPRWGGGRDNHRNTDEHCGTMLKNYGNFAKEHCKGYRAAVVCSMQGSSVTRQADYCTYG